MFMSVDTTPVGDIDGGGWLASRPRNPLTRVSLIVMHATAGTSLSGAISTLRQRGLGYHYLIDTDGRIVKGAPTSRVVGHAGNSYGPREQARGVSRQQRHGGEFVAGCSVNGYSIGVSFVHPNDGVTAITRKQWDAAVALVWALAAAHTIEWVTTHAIVSPGRKTDPRPFNLDAFAKECRLPAWRYT
jgi:N-acetyl-anhydromuramyl-L-alanine amidase AmpD